MFSISIYFEVYSYDDKAEFSASLPQSHNPSEIMLKCWFAPQETFHYQYWKQLFCL